MKAWQEGDIDELLREGRTMQHHLGHTKRKLDLDGEDEDGHTARVFSNLVFEGKIHSALRHLSDNYRDGVLSLDELVRKMVAG